MMLAVDAVVAKLEAAVINSKNHLVGKCSL